MNNGYLPGKQIMQKQCYEFFHAITCTVTYNSHHTWMSFEGAAEVYNETMRETKNFNYCNLKDFWSSYNANNKGNLILQIQNTILYIYLYNAADDCVTSDLHRKTLANAFWTYQVEQEPRERNDLDYVFHGKRELDAYMDKVDSDRANSVYLHENCTDECKKRGQ